MPIKSKSDLSTKDAKTLEKFLVAIEKDYPYFIGFPGSTDFDYSVLLPFFGYLLNNVGDPFINPLHANHSKQLEAEVVDFFADLFRAPKNDRWGYVNNGGTEGNMYALYIARQLFPEAPVIYSDAAHYSIPKTTGILRMKEYVIPSDQSGEMDYLLLGKKLKEINAKKVIIVATIGTTMTEAKDNISTIKDTLSKVGYGKTDYYIHCDAALAGAYSAFSTIKHPFDFEDGADSISISGHKFLGCPMPSGVIITKKTHRDTVVRDSLYTGSPDSTLSGSRNGHTPIMLWYAIKKLGIDGLRKRAIHSMELADYLQKQLQAINWKSWKNESAFTVVIKRPPEEIIHKWQLATYGEWSHVICMPGVTKERLDIFIEDLKGIH